MRKEIGSEFHLMPFESGTGLLCPVPGSFVFSGRTAIDTVLKNIPNVKKAMLPSYCCSSMIEPFIRNGIEVIFFPVEYMNELVIELHIPDDVDVLLWCNYFGFKLSMPDCSSFINRGGIIIEDITHSFFSNKQYHSQTSFLVASLRKWEPIICGGYCAALDSELHYSPENPPPQKFTEKKQKAMEMKTHYLIDMDYRKKREFLTMFSESNEELSSEYSDYSMDLWSKEYLTKIDMSRHREIRRENARVLYEELCGVQFLCKEAEMDCPLFVPILLHNRDKVRKALIENNIYCPVHWPRPENCQSNIYDYELSLVCDQRYGKEDMKDVAMLLKKLI